MWLHVTGAGLLKSSVLHVNKSKILSPINSKFKKPLDAGIKESIKEVFKIGLFLLHPEETSAGHLWYQEAACNGADFFKENF